MVDKSYDNGTAQENSPEGIVGGYKELTFEVYGKPKAKQRPRFDSRTGNVYTPKGTKNKEFLVGMAYKSSCHGMMFDRDEAVYMRVDEYFGIPKSVSKKKRKQMMDGEIRPMGRMGDVENIAKLVMDALNGVAYPDDSQVVELWCRKFYGEEPKTVIYMAGVSK